MIFRLYVKLTVKSNSRKILALYAQDLSIQQDGEIMTSSFYTSVEYNYQNAFRNLVCNVIRSNHLSIRFGNSMFARK